MDKLELVKMWMAQGYIKETLSRDMKFVGNEYFQVLTLRSIFQDFEINKFHNMRLKMDDVVHDFA